MNTAKDAEALYADALELNRTAMAMGHYAVAYHALAAAMHSAVDLDDPTRLTDIGNIAANQRHWIATQGTEHALIDKSAFARVSQSLWDTLEREVQSRLRMIEQRRLIDQLHADRTNAISPDDA
jgi:hypothetical protein